MARPQRIELANAFYHVSNGKKSRKPLFPSALHTAMFMEQVLLAGRRFNVELHGWCLHKFHYQLLVKTPEANLSRFMRQVDGLYTLRCQQLQGRSGSVFTTRYKSVLIQDSLVADVLHYLHQQADKSAVNEFGFHASSMAAYCGRQKPAFPVVTGQVLGSGSAGRRMLAQQQASTPPEHIVRFFNRKSRPALLGDAGFISKIRVGSLRRVRVISKRKRPAVHEIVSNVAQLFAVSETSIVQAARGPDSKNIPRWVAMHLCQEMGGVTLQEIARHFGLQRYGTVSTTIGKLRTELPDNPRLQRQVNKLVQSLGH